MSSEEEEADVEQVCRVPTGVNPDSVPAPQPVPFKRISDNNLGPYRYYLPTCTQLGIALRQRDAEDPKVPPPQQFGFLPMCDAPAADWKGKVHPFGVAVVDTKSGKVYRQLQMNLVYTPKTLSLPYRRVSGAMVHLDSQENHDSFVSWYEDIVVSILEDINAQNAMEVAIRLHDFIQAVVFALPVVLYKIVQRAVVWANVSNALIKDVFMIRHPPLADRRNKPVPKFTFRFADILSKDFGDAGCGFFCTHICSVPNGNRQPAHKPGTTCCSEHADPVLDPLLLSTFLSSLAHDYRDLFEFHYLFIQRDEAASADGFPFPKSTTHWRRPLASFGCAFGDFIGLDTHRMVGIKLDEKFIQCYRNTLGHTQPYSPACGVTIMTYNQKPCLVEWVCENQIMQPSSRFLELDSYAVLWATRHRQFLPYYPHEVRPEAIDTVSLQDEEHELCSIPHLYMQVVIDDREGALHTAALAAWFLADHFREVSVEWLMGVESYFANREWDSSKLAADIRAVRTAMAVRMPNSVQMTKQCKDLVSVSGFYSSKTQTGTVTLHDHASDEQEEDHEDAADETYTDASRGQHEVTESGAGETRATRKRKRRRGKNRSGRKPPAKRVKTDL